MKPLHILTIDDDLDFANAVQIAIEAKGHRVTATHNWLTFMSKLKFESYDAIVADVETPTGNGLSAIGFLCSDPSIQEIPKVFVTGRSDDETKNKCQSLDALYLHKSLTVFADIQSFVAGVADSRNLVTA